MNFELDETDRAKPEIGERLLTGCDNLADVAREWLKTPGNTLSLSTAVDDNDVHNLITVEFGTEKEDATVFYVPLEVAFHSWPGLCPISDFVSEVNDGRNTRLEYEDEKLEQHLGFSLKEPFVFDLQGALLPFEHMLRYAAMFAVANVGVASFAGIPRDDEEPFEDERLTADRVLWVHLGYRLTSPSNGTLPGTGEDLYCFRPGAE